MQKRSRHSCTRPSRLVLLAVIVLSWTPARASAQEATLAVLPVRPFNVDIAVRQQNFAPNDREITIQAGITALRYGDLEVRSSYQYFSVHTQDFRTDQHAFFVNPRWNNFIDVLDFPKGMPINRLIRHALFGPLEDRAVPYIGALGGGVISDTGHPGHLYGGQIGVRFPVAQGLSLDIGMQYSRYGVEFRSQRDEAQQWVFLTGIRF